MIFRTSTFCPCSFSTVDVSHCPQNSLLCVIGFDSHSDRSCALLCSEFTCVFSVALFIVLTAATPLLLLHLPLRHRPLSPRGHHCRTLVASVFTTVVTCITALSWLTRCPLYCHRSARCDRGTNLDFSELQLVIVSSKVSLCNEQETSWHAPTAVPPPPSSKTR
jgi:hypothetical protein